MNIKSSFVGAGTALILLCTGGHAAEIRTFSLPGLRVIMEELQPKFEMSSGNKVTMQYGTLAQAKKILQTENYDVMIYTSPMIADLIKQGKVGPSKPIVISRVKIGVAVRSGSPKPDISSAEAFKRVMLAAKSISYTKDSPAGVFLSGLMVRLGIADVMTPKTKLLGGGGQNPRAVAAGEVEIGLSIIPDMIGVSGVDIVGSLPADLNPPALDFAAGIKSASGVTAEAEAFLRYLKSPAVASVFSAKGMEQAAGAQ